MTLYDLVRPVLFRLPAELAHESTLRVLRTIQATPFERALASRYVVDDDRLASTVFGHTFPNPVGIAAGFDKNGEIPAVLASLGFGHVEIGAVTEHRQPGTDRPRLFRLVEDRALINRMGFNNHGADAIREHLIAGPAPSVPMGINLGKSKITPLEDAASDYRYSYECLAAHGDFFVVNVSSPNTPGLRSLQGTDPLRAILAELRDAGAAPLLLKLSPDLAPPAIEDALDVAREVDLDGIVAVNTTIDRPESLRSSNRRESGGLSGAPLTARSTEVIRFVATRVDVPVIGVGGIFTADDAYRKLRAGASLVQLYTGLVYRGPSIARSINRGLVERLEEDGFDTIEDVVGVDIE